MNFKAFQSSRAYVEDIDLAMGMDNGRGRVGGYLYDSGACYIEENTASDISEKFCLMIYRDEWFSDDLEELEKILWATFYLHEAVPSEFMIKGSDLDYYVQGECAARRIEVDGDAFGMVFSGKDEFTAQEASALVDDAIRIYELDKR